jgi:hypothetical protein
MRHLLQGLRLMLTFWRKRYLVEISFKSGNVALVWAYKFDIKMRGNELQNVTLLTCLDDYLFLDIEQIESIVVVRSRGWIKSH